MNEKMPSKVITLANYPQQIYCNVCASDVYHNVTVQIIKNEDWYAVINSVCWRCKNSEKMKFKAVKD